MFYVCCPIAAHRGSATEGLVACTCHAHYPHDASVVLVRSHAAGSVVPFASSSAR